MSQTNYTWAEWADQLELAAQLAADIAAQLTASIQATGLARIAVSGGSTPKPMFEALSEHDVDWSKVIITLVDERVVDESHELSNAAFLKKHLLDKLGIAPKFLPLFVPGADFAATSAEILTNYRALTGNESDAFPGFDVVVLGMGGDGHTASFFPDAANIADLVDPNSPHALLGCESPSTQVARITWSLPVLLNTQSLILHITGAGKKAVFDAAKSNDNALELPIRAAIFQQTVPLNVYFAE